MTESEQREPATDQDAPQETEESTGVDLLPEADPEPTGGAKYSKDEKVNHGEDMLP